METARESFGGLTSVVRVAVHSDDPGRLIAAASMAIQQPLALVGPDGESLGHAPDGSEGRRALAVASAASRNRLVGAAGWSIVPVTRGSVALGFLAIGARGRRDAAVQALLEILPELVAEQQHRLEVLRARGTAFVRRLVGDPRFGERDARMEADALGLGLADAYWPAILAWHDHMPPGAVVKRLTREALAQAHDSLSAPMDRGIALLHPGHGADPYDWLDRIVVRARALAPSFPAQVVAAEAPVRLAGVGTKVAELEALWRMGPRRRGDPRVVTTREYALERLLWEDLDADAARRFVDDQLGPLVAWDREHRPDLMPVLEAALDFPRHDLAASRCFMHRNTFRHRLQQAEEVLGRTLEDPNVRLATHVALKLRRLLATSAADISADEQGAPPSAASHRPRHRTAGSPSGPPIRPRSRGV